MTDPKSKNTKSIKASQKKRKKNVFWADLFMGGELGDGTYIDVPLVSYALSPQIFTLIGNTDIYTNSV